MPLIHPLTSVDRLVPQAIGGDEQAFHGIFDATYLELRLFVCTRARSQELVDEVVQATFVTAFESLGTYRQGGAFLAWLKGIARHRLQEERRRRARLMPLSEIGDVSEEPPDISDLGQRLDGCLGRLSTQARQLLELRYRQGMAVQDIATHLGRTAGSVSVSLHRLRQVLAECLGPEVVPHA